MENQDQETDYFAINRSIFDHWLWDGSDKPKTEFEAWIDLISQARYTPKKNVLCGKLRVNLDRGQQIASVRFLQKRWLWSNTKVVKFIELLKSDGMIKTDKKTGVTVLTISNYNIYQAPKENKKTDKKTPKRQISDTKTTDKRHQNDETNKDKKGNNANNGNNELATTHAIAWSIADGWSNISANDKSSWLDAYPACDTNRQLAAMTQWLLSNPSKAKKSQWRRFITNWLSRQQDRGGDIQSVKPTNGSSKSFAEIESDRKAAIYQKNLNTPF